MDAVHTIRVFFLTRSYLAIFLRLATHATYVVVQTPSFVRQARIKSALYRMSIAVRKRIKETKLENRTKP